MKLRCFEATFSSVFCDLFIVSFIVWKEWALSRPSYFAYYLILDLTCLYLALLEGLVVVGV